MATRTAKSNRPSAIDRAVAIERGIVARTRRELGLTPEPQALTPFDIHGMEQAIALSERVSASGLIPTALRGKPNDVLIILMAGHELGLPPMRSLQDLVVIEGRVGMYADAAVALAQGHPDICLYFRLIESTAKVATYETQRAGSPDAARMSWTIEQAQRAGLLGKDPWKKYPEAMLRHRCAMALARSEYPDLLRGVYDREDDVYESINVTPGGVPQPPIVKVVPSSPKVVPPPASEATVPAESSPAEPAPEPTPPAEPTRLEKLLVQCQELAAVVGVPDAKVEKGMASILETERGEGMDPACARAEKWLGQLKAAQAAAQGPDAPGADSAA